MPRGLPNTPGPDCTCDSCRDRDRAEFARRLNLITLTACAAAVLTALLSLIA